MPAMAWARQPDDGYIHVLCECDYHQRVVIPNSSVEDEEKEADRRIKHHLETGCFTISAQRQVPTSRRVFHEFWNDKKNRSLLSGPDDRWWVATPLNPDFELPDVKDVV